MNKPAMFVNFASFASAFSKASSDKVNFTVVIDDNEPEVALTPHKASALIKDAEYAHLVATFADGKKAHISFTTEWDYTAKKALTMVCDYSENDKLLSYFGNFLEKECEY